ncbi:MAG: zinc-binding dehydrogenase, partial [Pseudomonadota bacterium]
GIGVAAIQMARALGARVFTTAGSDERCAACRELGAEVAVNHREQDFVEVLSAATDGRGVDVILDMVGGEYTQRNIALAAEDGRIACIAAQLGMMAEINLVGLMMKRVMLTGSTLRPRSIDAKAEIATALEAQVWPLLAEGRIKAVIDRIFQLDDASDAHVRMESGAHVGKLLLEIR